MNNKKVFVDLDGVLVDFVGGVNDWYELPDTLVYPAGVWDIVPIVCEHLNISRNTFWSGLTEDFWRTLNKTKEADDLLQYLEPFEPCLLSSPASPASAAGKISWIKNNLPNYWKKGNFCLNRNKTFLAHSNSILIDDYDLNVDEFRKHGGKAILFPRWCNRDYKISLDSEVAYQYVLEQFTKEIDND